jgi:DNA-binding NarL/FixJ family response regulator
MDDSNDLPCDVAIKIKVKTRNLPDAASSGFNLQHAGKCTPVSPIGVVLLDDRALYRDSLRTLIHSVDPLLTVTEAASPAEVTTLIHESSVPMVVFANIVGAEQERLQWLDHVREALPDTPLGVLSEIDDAATVRALLHKGVRGVIPPTTPGSVFVGALRVLSLGGTYIPPSVLWRSPAEESSAAVAASTDQIILRAFPTLTARQAAVLRLLAEGLTNQQIAETFQISKNTVKVHVHNIFGQLEVHRRTEAAQLVRKTIEAAAAGVELPAD